MFNFWLESYNIGPHLSIFSYYFQTV
uniref:Uncharacterized protein n=1 Tax=Anguilla anguilla TaxID=7936 RepID=A0A0E9Q113_ANGAN